ncbi:hypothetical protein MUK42_26145 [Musa troglodytarum]|uniref:TOD1/MUCI70 glycosyltransferase-like domain-containing protein n=1 Tax=Musa troglodytarum TaxID=320322 RepID=A0A9E7I641_9LILI|nr:hypothetical protein MUK42_26145 [Musa troglodytarum]
MRWKTGGRNHGDGSSALALLAGFPSNGEERLGYSPQRFFSGCGIPVVDDPDTIVIPKRTPDTVPKSLTYVLEDEQENADEKSQPLFGGHQNWKQRENSFKLNTTMKVHCGFIKNGGGEVDAVDVKYAKKCRHTREHSSVVEWVKSLDEFKGNMTGLRETRGGLGLWKPYPGDLSSVQLPSVKRTSPAG